MDKDKILEKSRKENELGDEREKLINDKSNSLYLTFLMITGIVIIAWDLYHDIDVSRILAMFWAGCLGQYIFRYCKTKNKTNMTISILSFILLIKNLAEHFIYTK